MPNHPLLAPTNVEGGGHYEIHTNLAKLRGAEFDRAYMKRMVDEHRRAVQLFAGEAKKNKDAELRAFATQTLPALQAHWKRAQEIYEKVSTEKDKK